MQKVFNGYKKNTFIILFFTNVHKKVENQGTKSEKMKFKKIAKREVNGDFSRLHCTSLKQTFKMSQPSQPSQPVACKIFRAWYNLFGVSIQSLIH